MELHQPTHLYKIRKDGNIMNAYYEHNSIYNNKRSQISIPATHISDKIISAICMIVAFFTCTVAVRIEKTVLSAVCFFGFFGAIGSIESATLSPILGILLCAAFGYIEYLVLKSLFAKKK